MANRLVATRTKRAGQGRERAQLQVERRDRWTADKERRFLTVLAVTSNVAHALREVGMSAAGLYDRRRKNPGFAQAWDHALSEGYAKLEAEMLARAMHDGTADRVADGETALRPMADSTMLALLAAHGKRVAQFRATVSSQALTDSDKLRREITLRLDRLARSLGIEVTR